MSHHLIITSHLLADDTTGDAQGTTLTEAELDYDAVKMCSASKSDAGKLLGNEEEYAPDTCCNGWFHADDCAVSDFCHNSLAMCQWYTCATPMEVFAAANGVMIGIHVFFFMFMTYVQINTPLATCRFIQLRCILASLQNAAHFRAR